MSAPHPEIIIVRRRGGEDEGPHGGAWKIALADFMTAMMALFLVMWLIGATSKEQKKSIAEYFNPVKLAEVTHDRRGLRDPQDTPADPGAEGGRGDAKGDGGGAGDRRRDGGEPGSPGSRARESALFQDPYAVLSRLAAEAESGSEAASADAGALESGALGISGGEAGRDPFDPLYWQTAAQPRHRTDQPGAPGTTAPPPADGRLDARGLLAQTPRKPAKDAGQDPLRQAMQAAVGEAGIRLASADPDAPALSVREPSPAGSPPNAATATEPPAGDAAIKPPPGPAAAEAAAIAALKAEIAGAVKPLATGAPAPRIEVRRSGEGVLISVTDDVNFSMFGVGSAEPTPKVVRALERIARILSAKPGRIVVRGHTDGRPFRSETYDNWRLSSARAQMAAYMLVRGGVDEARLERVEGHADRQPRTADPKAAENRRIEILLRGLPE